MAPEARAAASWRWRPLVLSCVAGVAFALVIAMVLRHRNAAHAVPTEAAVEAEPEEPTTVAEPGDGARERLEREYPSLAHYPDLPRTLRFGLRRADALAVMEGLAIALREPVAQGSITRGAPFIDPTGPVPASLSQTAAWLEAARLLYAPTLPASALYPEPANASAADVDRWIAGQPGVLTAPLHDTDARQQLAAELAGPHLCSIWAPRSAGTVAPHVFVAHKGNRKDIVFALEASPAKGLSYAKRRLGRLGEAVGAARRVPTDALSVRCSSLQDSQWEAAEAEGSAGADASGPKKRRVVMPSIDAWLRAPGSDEPLPDAIAEIGADVDIHDPKGALAGFHRKLSARESGKRKLVRITHFGDSAIVDDGITAYARRMLQRRYGDGGHGIALFSPSRAWRHRDIWLRADGWTVETVVRPVKGLPRFGVAGAAAEGSTGAHSTIGPRKRHTGFGRDMTKYRALLEGSDTGGELSWRFGDDAWEVVDTHRDTPETIVAEIAVPDDQVGEAHRLRFRVTEGRVRGFVISAEGDKGLIYDSAGLLSSRARSLLRIDADQFEKHLGILGTDLVVLQYGGNGVWFHTHRPKRFLRQLGDVMARARGEGRACLVLGPVGGREAYRPMCDDIRDLAEASGCAFWDTPTAMGGDDAMARWRESPLPLVWADLGHLQPKGGAVVAALLVRALARASRVGE